MRCAPSPRTACAIIRGMSRQVSNEIDEYVTDALRNDLVGLPLDLAALNIARARDTGVPSLNAVRADFFAQTGDTQLEPYSSWFDFALAIKTPASVINFIAAYGTHSTITGATTLVDKRAAAMALVFGGDGSPLDRLDFLNGTGTWASTAAGPCGRSRPNSRNRPRVALIRSVRVAIQALRTLNYARSLAEPNMTALNGQTATFSP